MSTNEFKFVIRTDKRSVGEHKRRFNALTVNEMLTNIMIRSEFDKRVIIIQKRSEILQRISERLYNSLFINILTR